MERQTLSIVFTYASALLGILHRLFDNIDNIIDHKKLKQTG